MKNVKIADLRARLSEHLREVRRGHVLTVFDRATPIAQVVPYGGEPERLRIRRPLGRSALNKVPLPRPLRLDIDILDLLTEAARR